MAVTISDDWSSYWAHSAGPAGGVRLSLTSTGPAAMLASFWQSTLAPALDSPGRVRLLDIACGAGVVVALASDACHGLSRANVELHCSDYSHEAVRLAAMPRGRVTICGTTADARQMPYADQALDIIVSQFGIEYAGVEGFREAARLLAPGGRLCLVIHRRGGPIYTECLANQAVLQDFKRSGLIRLCRRVLALADLHDEGRAAPSAFDRRMGLLHLALQDMACRLSDHPAGPARAHIELFLQDIPKMLARRAAYAPGAALGWIDAQGDELQAFSQRMAAMLAVAMDAEQIEESAALLKQEGLSEVAVGELSPAGAPAAIAWTLRATGT